jgi:hypothetical protein
MKFRLPSREFITEGEILLRIAAAKLRRVGRHFGILKAALSMG